MKTLQNNFTTPEQSKKLLELGVPADSADMCYTINDDTKFYNTVPVAIPYYQFTAKRYYLPGWSVGRLIEILKICVTDKNELHEIFEELEMCIDEIKTLVQTFKEYSDVIDFSKLDEQEKCEVPTRQEKVLGDCNKGDKVWIRDIDYGGYIQVQIINSYPPQNTLPYIDVLYLDDEGGMDDLSRDVPCWENKPKQ